MLIDLSIFNLIFYLILNWLEIKFYSFILIFNIINF